MGVMLCFDIRFPELSRIDVYKRQVKGSTQENNPLKKKEKSAELKEFENAKEDFMDSVFKNMEKEYTDLGNPENADFSRGGQSQNADE